MKQGNKNIYMCKKCGHGFITQDGDATVTPFLSPCRQTGCDGLASSFMYMAPQKMLEQFPPAIIWTKERMGEK